MKDWTEIISEARDRNKDKAERQRRLKIAKTSLKGSALLNKGKDSKNGDKKDSRYLDYLERRQKTREQQIAKQREQEEINKKQKLIRSKEKNLEKSKQNIRSAIGGVKTDTIGAEEEGATATMKALGNLGSLAGGLAKAAIHTPGYLKAKRDLKKAKETEVTSNQPEKARKRKKPGRPKRPGAPSSTQKSQSPSPNPNQKRLVPATKRLPPSGGVPEGSRGPKAMTLGQRARKNPKIKAGLISQRMNTEEFSNWRQEFTEEFLFEIDELKNDKNKKTDKKSKVVDLMKGTNSKIVEINPNISEDHKEIASGEKKDDEGYMANVELDQMERAIKALRKKIKRADTQMPAWVQSKITRAADYIDTASDYLMSDAKESYEEILLQKLMEAPKPPQIKSSVEYPEMMSILEQIQGGLWEAKKSEMKCNKPRAEAHGSGETGKSHVVKACSDGKEKLIRFGQLGVKGSPKKEGESEEYANRRKRFKTRHAKNIAKGKMSAAYWSNLVKW